MKTYYVYLLTDPRNNHEVFYCGKGTGDRWKSHLGHWSGNGKNNPTENKIKKIQEQGLQPGIIFLHENIQDENEAYLLEENYIREHFNSLTNLKIEANPPKFSFDTHPRGMKDKKHSEISKKKISLSGTGKKKIFKNKELWRQNVSQSLQKEKHPMWGKPANNRRPVIETTTNTFYTDQKTAANSLGLRQGDIANCLAGRQKSVKGFRFVYQNQ